MNEYLSGDVTMTIVNCLANYVVSFVYLNNLY